MDRTQAIGITLLLGLFYVFMVFNSPSPEEQEAMQRRQDSLNAIQTAPAPETETTIAPISPQDSNGNALPIQSIQEEIFTLSNDLISIDFSNKGAQIVEAELSKHFQMIMGENHEKTKVPLKMMDNPEDYLSFKVKGVNGGTINTGETIFQGRKSGNRVTFNQTIQGVPFEIEYELGQGYTLNAKVRAQGIDNATTADDVQMQWISHLNKLELNVQYEKYYSTVYYKEVDENPDYCSCRGDDDEVIDDKKVAWISSANQFFNTAIIPESPFSSTQLQVTMPADDKSESYLKVIDAKANLPIEAFSDQGLALQMYIGPNDFEILREFGNDLEDVIPFGSSIFGTVNRWFIRPLFNFLKSGIASAGLVIILLTFLVKLLLYPFTYRMLKSQMKMAALKPEIEKVKNKFKDDQQKQQMETMKLYREYGANPLGGCMPMVLQMPIWFALYRFFPASIEFRQKAFWWADDLSSYDAFAYLPFDIPMFGSHISLFTILWVLTTLAYTWYNSKLVDMSANPAMKYMQYLMPVMFLFFFNNYASGLTAYLMFSNLFNITQTVVTKNFVFNEAKIREELELNKNKPKKKGGFQERLEKALKEQQKIQAARDQQKKKK